MFMGKKAISLTIREANLVWLQGVTARSGARSISETVDRIITDARQQALGPSDAVTSVVGSVDLHEDDPRLDGADAVVRELFGRSLARPLVVKERPGPHGRGQRPARAPRG